MTPTEHRTEAQRLLAVAIPAIKRTADAVNAGPTNGITVLVQYADAQSLLLGALVHAMLAIPQPPEGEVR